MEERKVEQWGKEQAEANFQRMISEMRYWEEAQEVFQPVKTVNRAYFHPLYVEAVKRLPYIWYWLDEFIEKGGKKEWKKFQLTQETTT